MAEFLDPLVNFFTEVGSLTRVTRKTEDSSCQSNRPRKENADSKESSMKKSQLDISQYHRADAGLLLTYEIINGKGTGEFVVEDILDQSSLAMNPNLISIGDRVIEIDEVRLMGKSLAEANALLSGRHRAAIGIKLFSVSKNKEYNVRMVLRSHRSKLDWSMKNVKTTRDPNSHAISPKDPYCPSFTRQDIDTADDMERERALKVAAEYSKQQAELNSAVPRFSASSAASSAPSKIPDSFRFV